ncbi:hypothetical protein BT96DRAFT_1009108 [Gymnopus androsaceus JB14]|uniref:D-lyxose ketol-isomerase n=1 Tax=Gymnopus androsaceus JB14 TaxID=1447944 RepID=A0A6A4GDL3_9AGAR|nr:hypothetical protein BT96DRAFT_1009108 [Gymnopus androsaceus JB14]
MSFLFPRASIPPKRDPDSAWNFFDGASRTWVVQSDEHSFTSGHFLKHSNPHTGAGRSSTITPPYHWHIYQTERFDVQSGVLCYLLNGKEGKLLAGESVTISPYQYHTFWSDPESGVDLVVHISVSGGPNTGFDDTFIHNFYGYLSSAVMQGKSPKLLQMLAFLDHADVVLADFPLWTGRLANIVLGRWIGRGLGGLEVEYKEFSEKSD